MRKNKKIAGVAGLAAIMVIGGTFAYFNQTMSVTNPFDTGKYDTSVTEDFKPEDGDNWEPGAEVNKDVTVKNTGDYDVLVRVKLTEKWVNKTTSETIAENTTGLKGNASQANANDGLTTGDYSVVEKTLNDANWVYNDADGYWYYKTNLASKADTGIFLDAVKLLENTDMGKYTVTNYYTTAETKPSEDMIGVDPATSWVAYTGNVPEDAKHSMAVTNQDPNAPGYGNADYTLTITAQTVQATDAAMKDAFGLTSQPTGCSWNLTQNK
jgi:alternate signal-mediated exported protein